MRLELIPIIIPAITILVIGLITIMIGIYGLQNKRAIIIRNLFYYGSYQLVLLSFLYSPLQFLVALNPANLAGQILLSSICLLPPLVYIVFRIFRYRKNFYGYTVIGGDETIFEAIRDALKLKGIPFEEAHEDFWLSEPHSQITTYFPPLLGTVIIRIEPWSLHLLLDSIMDAMKSPLEEREDYYNGSAMTRFIFLGILLSAFGLIIAIAAISKT